MHYPLIDILRALAALLVLTFHVTTLGQWAVFAEPAWGLPFRNGWAGVDLFFVISGFVITLSAARELDRDPTGFKLQFMRRRLRRLVPLYLLTCVIYVLMVRPEVLTRSSGDFLLQVVSHALFLQNLMPSTHGVINGVTWSLALEMQFYLLLVFSIGGLVRLGPGRSLLLLIAISWAWRYATTLVLVPGQATMNLQVIYASQLPGTLDEFGMGIALALVVFKNQGAVARRLNLSWRNFLIWSAVAVALLWMAGALLLPRANYWDHVGMIIFWRTVLAMGFAAALAAMMTCPLRGGGPLRPLRYLGQVSYGIYLWHFPVLLALLTLPAMRGGRLFGVLIGGAVTLAALSWHLMEKRWIQASKSMPLGMPTPTQALLKKQKELGVVTAARMQGD